MYEYTTREQALWRVLACIYECHSKQDQALAQIDDLLAQMQRDDEKRPQTSQLALRQEVELVKASLC